MTIQLKLLPTLALAMLALPMVAFAQSDVGDRAYEQADSVLKRLPNITRQMPSSSITDARLTSIVVVPVVTQQVVTPVLAFVPAAPPVAPLAAPTPPAASAALVTSSDDVYSCLSQGFPSSYVGEVVYRRTLTNGVTTGYALFSNTCAAPASSAPSAPVAPVITTNNIVSSCQANGYGPEYSGQVTYAEQLTNGVRTSYTGVSNTCSATLRVVSDCQANGYPAGWTGQIVYVTPVVNGNQQPAYLESNTCVAPPFESIASNLPPAPVITTSVTTRQCTASDFLPIIDQNGMVHYVTDEPFGVNRFIIGSITTQYTTTNGVTDQGVVVSSFPCQIVVTGIGK